MKPGTSYWCPAMVNDEPDKPHRMATKDSKVTTELMKSSASVKVLSVKACRSS